MLHLYCGHVNGLTVFSRRFTGGANISRPQVLPHKPHGVVVFGGIIEGPRPIKVRNRCKKPVHVLFILHTFLDE